MLKYLREDIKKLKAYQVNNIEYIVKLDANEGIDWLEGNNRYPDDDCSKLRDKLALKLGNSRDELLIGNGSSELIELVMKAYLEAGEMVISISPTFSMYNIYTIINKGLYEEYPLDNMSTLNVDGFIGFIKKQKPKIVIIGNPNNPTGSVISKEDIIKIVNACDCMVILDEAYIEFADMNPMENIVEYKNLICLRTFSKAYGLAGIRLGYMIASEETIGYINRVRSPYNVNSLSQEIGLKAIENDNFISNNIKLIKSERKRVRQRLEELGYSPYPSQTNFLLFKADEDLSTKLIDEKILIRAFGGDLQGYYRLTIGQAEENDTVLKAIEGARK